MESKYENKYGILIYEDKSKDYIKEYLYEEHVKAVQKEVFEHILQDS